MTRTQYSRYENCINSRIKPFKFGNTPTENKINSSHTDGLVVSYTALALHKVRTKGNFAQVHIKLINMTTYTKITRITKQPISSKFPIDAWYICSTVKLKDGCDKKWNAC